MTSKWTMKCLAGLSVLFLLAISGVAFAATGVAGVDTGIAMVMDADTIGLANGSEFTSWADLSGLGNNLHTWTWSNLNYVQYLTNQLNGHAVVRFRGQQDGGGYVDPMWTNTNAITGGTLTLFLVLNDRQTQWADGYPDYAQSVVASIGGLGWYAPSVMLWNRSWNGTAWDPSLAYLQEMGTWQEFVPGSGAASFVPYQQYGVMTIQLNGANSFASLNGVVKATGDATGAVFAGDFMLGGMAGNNSGRAAVIDVAAVVIYNRALSSDEENNVGSFLAGKYGIATSYTHNRGVHGYVEDYNHNRVAGAIVSVDGGVESATTDSAGNYTLEVYETGSTCTIRAAKAGFADAVQPGVTVPSSGHTTLNLTMHAMASMSGQVKSALPGNPPIAGASIVLMSQADSERTYTSKTDSAGNYSASVQANDTYQVEVSASGYKLYPDYSQMPGGVLITFAANQSLHQDFTLTHSGTWSLTNDFSLAFNPNGQWSYGYYTETGDSQDPATNVFSLLSAATLPFQPELAGWHTSVPQGWPPSNTWNWSVWLAKNTSGRPVEGVPTDTDYYIERDAMSFGGGDFNLSTPVIRWTAPDTQYVDLTFTIRSQVLNGKTHWTDYDGDSNSYVTLLKNQSAMASKSVQGFLGRAVNNLTDSIGPAPTTTFATTIAVNSGDTLDLALGRPHGALDHWNGNYGYPYASLDVYMAVAKNTTVHTASTVAAIKALNQGDIVIVTTPLQLCCPSSMWRSFAHPYGSPAVSEYSFYVMSDDRTQGIKCLTDGTAPTYDETKKITFTGTIDIQNGQKVVRVSSINSAVAGSAKPLGKGAKALANSNTLVRVWGKITHLEPVSNSDPYVTYEYITINDGAQDIKIPMHVQVSGISNYDANIAHLALNHYVSVTGIAGTTNGSDVVVCPRDQSDFRDYTQEELGG